MNIEDLRYFCLKLPGVTEDIKWDSNLTFCVSEKIFCITSLDEYPIWVTLKTDKEIFEKLTRQHDIVPAPYLGRAKWFMLKDITLFDDRFVKEHIIASYNIIRGKLPKKIQNELPPLS